jgi:hypothetical protein
MCKERNKGLSQGSSIECSSKILRKTPVRIIRLIPTEKLQNTSLGLCNLHQSSRHDDDDDYDDDDA